MISLPLWMTHFKASPPSAIMLTSAVCMLVKEEPLTGFALSTVTLVKSHYWHALQYWFQSFSHCAVSGLLVPYPTSVIISPAALNRQAPYLIPTQCLSSTSIFLIGKWHIGPLSRYLSPGIYSSLQHSHLLPLFFVLLRDLSTHFSIKLIGI